MSDVQPPDPLDQLLQQWAAHENASDRVASLQTRIVQQVNDGPVIGATTAASLQGHAQGNRPAMRVAAISALGVLLLLGAFLFNVRPEHSISVAELDDVSVDARFSEEELEAHRQLLAEMHDLFNSQLKWVAETDRRVELFIEDADPEAELETQPAVRLKPVCFVVRMIVEHRDSQTAPWRKSTQLDVLSQNEDVVRVPALGSNPAVTFWAYAMPDGHVAVESQFDLNGNATPSPSVSHVLSAGEPELISTGDRQGRQYRVFQTVAFLEPHKGQI